MICPVSASAPIWSFLQDRRSDRHSPGEPISRTPPPGNPDRIQNHRCRHVIGGGRLRVVARARFPGLRRRDQRRYWGALLQQCPRRDAGGLVMPLCGRRTLHKKHHVAEGSMAQAWRTFPGDGLQNHFSFSPNGSRMRTLTANRGIESPLHRRNGQMPRISQRVVADLSCGQKLAQFAAELRLEMPTR